MLISIGDWRMDIHGTFAKELESRGVSSSVVVFILTSFFCIVLNLLKLISEVYFASVFLARVNIFCCFFK